MILPDDVAPGLVLRYAYLWAAEAAQGRDEGRKDRPVVVVLKREVVAGASSVIVAPITHSPPRNGTRAVPMDPRLKARLGLDDEASWIVTDEVNVFVWPGPDLRPIGGSAGDRCDYGYLPNTVFHEVVAAIALNRREQRLDLTRRDD